MAPEQNLTLAVRLKIDGEDVDLQFDVPEGPAGWDDLLPQMRELAEQAVALGQARSEREGRPISCRAGCGACCRQFVPISEFEAHRIRAVVEQMPEERQTEIRRRFADARTRLEQAGLLDTLENQRVFEPDEAGEFGKRYFAAQVACPFLENESCSIYEERPIRCREYLVTSPAENCSNPAADPIDQVPLPLYVSSANSRLSVGASDRNRDWVALSLALDWTERHTVPPEEQSGPELVQKFLVTVTGRQSANAPSDAG